MDKILMIIAMLMTGLISGGCTPNGFDPDQILQNVETQAPRIRTAVKLTVYTILESKEEGPELADKLSIWLDAIDGIVEESGSVDLSDLTTLADTYLTDPKQKVIAVIIIDVAQNEIDLLLMNLDDEEQEARLELVRKITKAVVDGAGDGVDLYLLINPRINLVSAL